MSNWMNGVLRSKLNQVEKAVLFPSLTYILYWTKEWIALKDQCCQNNYIFATDGRLLYN